MCVNGPVGDIEPAGPQQKPIKKEECVMEERDLIVLDEGMEPAEVVVQQTCCKTSAGALRVRLAPADES